MQIPERRGEAFAPHHFSDQSRISRLRHGCGAERVSGTVELQRIGNSERSSKCSEPVLEECLALHQIGDAVFPRIEGLLRTPFPAQTIAIMGVAKRWQKARTAMVVAECGTGKTLVSLGAIHVHCQGSPFTVRRNF